MTQLGLLTFTAALFLLSGHTACHAQSAGAVATEQGRNAGAAANAAVSPSLGASAVRAMTPGYTDNPPETSLRGSSNRDAEARARLNACSTTNQNDPSCQGITSAHTSANTSRPGVSTSDPDIVNTRAIAASPASVLGDLSEFYPGCARTDTPAPATTEVRACTRFEGVGAFSCSNSLSIRIERESNCTPRTWYASVSSGPTGLGVECRPELPPSSQHFRITQNGTQAGDFLLDMTAPPRAVPVVIGTAGTEPDSFTGVPFPLNIYLTSNTCVGDACSVSVVLAPAQRTLCNWSGETLSCETHTPFTYSFGQCPSGTSSGEHLEVWDTGARLDIGQCYAPSSTGYYVFDHSGVLTVPYNAIQVSPVVTRTVLGWQANPAFGDMARMTLNYTRATATVREQETWNNQCPALGTGGRCSVVTAPVCVDGPSTKLINEVPVTRACWQYSSSMSCAGSSVANQCDALASSGCTPISSSCAQTNATTGACEVHNDQYSCPVAAGVSTTVGNCPRNVSCVGESCFNTTRAANPDFARAVSMLEAVRQAGSHMDPDTMTVFNGEPNTCRDRALVNCCNSDPRGGTIVDSQYIEGSAYVYTLLTADGLGAFTAFGLTTLLLDRIAGCSDDETRLALKEGARLCHHVGDWCSSCVRVLGRCVRCITHTHMKCCFNSLLARVINQQGRAQIGKGWGSPESPDCSGFTIAQLQSLNFASMDLSEFYASIIATPPNTAAIQNENATRISNCYYGQGKCD